MREVMAAPVGAPAWESPPGRLSLVRNPWQIYTLGEVPRPVLRFDFHVGNSRQVARLVALIGLAEKGNGAGASLLVLLHHHFGPRVDRQRLVDVAEPGPAAGQRRSLRRYGC